MNLPLLSLQSTINDLKLKLVIHKLFVMNESSVSIHKQSSKAANSLNNSFCCEMKQYCV